MKRQTILLSDALNRSLVIEADKLELSISAVIRRILDEWREKKPCGK